MTAAAEPLPGSTAAAAPAGPARTTVNLSLVSFTASSAMVTVTVCVRAAPGAKAAVP